MRRANRWHTPLYVATNLLESMVIYNRPTIAEMNDIANTLLDGAHGLVLAAETAIGVDPVGAVDMVKQAIAVFEQEDFGRRIDVTPARGPPRPPSPSRWRTDQTGQSCRRSSAATSGGVNHDGSSRPSARRRRCSVPEMDQVSVPAGTSSSGLVRVKRRHVDDPMERDHRHAELGLQLGEELLARRTCRRRDGRRSPRPGPA